MNNKTPDIDSFLRENRPQVKDNPFFILEVQKKMRAVDGLKEEVDRQRRYGHMALVATLVFGLLAGALAVSLVYLYPVDHDAIACNIIVSIEHLLDPCKHYLLFATAVCAITLGIIFGGRKQNTLSIK